MTLSYKNVTYERHDRDLLKQLNGEVSAGTCLQVMGSNGSGKTTLLRIFASLLEPHQGDILWNSQSIFKIKNEYKRNIQYLGHQNAIKHNLTIYENIQFLASVYGQTIQHQNIMDIIGMIGLSKYKTLAGHLSAGQMRRLSIAKLLLKKTSVWILDEPLTALDIIGQEWIISLMNQHLEKKGLVIVATHRDLSKELNVNVQLLHIKNAAWSY